MAGILGPDIDLASASLIIQLQLEDAELYFASCKGKSREPTNEEQAFQMQIEELQGISQILPDIRMAESIAAAVQADGQILANIIAQEETAAKDRELALRWTGDEFPAAEETSQTSQDPSVLDDETLEKLQILYQGFFEVKTFETASEEPEPRESSISAAQRTDQRTSPMRECVACGKETEFVNVVRVPCQHEYCRSCLEDLFKASMTNETLFPPKCCQQPIAINIARIFMKSDIVHQFEKRKIEFETSDRTYCYKAQCSTFIPTAHIKDQIATCPDCECTTCTSCKARAHTGDCLKDIATQQLLATAEQNGWQRCFSCWRMVELEYGCDHITCRCGAEFCYNCGKRWKTCKCAGFEEHRLLARPYQEIDREESSAAVANSSPSIHTF